MKKVIWVANESENWHLYRHFEPIVEDVTGFNFKEDLCSETVKYMAKRFSETPYQRRFRSIFSIYQDDYKALVEKFIKQAENNAKIEVK
jgi:hypothetical protein